MTQSIVGIDSMVLIYANAVPVAERNPPPSDDEQKQLAELRVRAKLLLHNLNQDRATIILPTVAVAELQVPVPAPQRGTLLGELNRRFFCRPLDLPASTIASELWARHKQLPQDLQYRDRTVLKADAFIVATALAGGATRFYSSDKRCRAMAALVMEAFDLPRRGDDLFIENEIRRGEAEPPVV